MKESLLKNNSLKVERYYQLLSRHLADYSIISTDPPIFCTQYGYELDGFERAFKVLFEHLKDRRVYFLCLTGGYLEGAKIIAAIKKLEEKYQEFYPQFVFIHLCTTDRQHHLFTKNNLKAIFCSPNSMIDEKIFCPLPGVQKKYDAVYDASLSLVKRHYLAAEIENLALIFYYPSFAEIEMRSSQSIIDQVSHAHFFNNTASDNYKRLNPPQINEYLNLCRVGLCLSEEEGAMYASIQYLLAGLPVVTTPSRGGRDVFFESDYVLTVEPTPEAVNQGVRELIERNVPADHIRQKTLQKIQIHRQRFIDLVQEIYDLEGVNRSFKGEWEKVFFNKLHTIQNHHRVIEYIQQAEKNRTNQL